MAFFIGLGMGFEPIQKQYAGGILLPPVQKLVASLIFTCFRRWKCNRIPHPVSRFSAIHSDGVFYWPWIGIQTHFHARLRWSLARFRRVGIDTMRFAKGKTAIESLILFKLSTIRKDGFLFSHMIAGSKPPKVWLLSYARISGGMSYQVNSEDKMDETFRRWGNIVFKGKNRMCRTNKTDVLLWYSMTKK